MAWLSVKVRAARYEQIQRLADAERRSVAQMADLLLERALAEPGGGVIGPAGDATSGLPNNGGSPGFSDGAALPGSANAPPEKSPGPVARALAGAEQARDETQEGARPEPEPPISAPDPVSAGDLAGKLVPLPREVQAKGRR